MIKCITFYSFLIFSLLSASTNAQPHVLSSHVQLNNQNKTILNDTDLWLQTQSLNRNPSFVELSQLYQSAKPASSTIGGSGAYITKIDLTSAKSIYNTWFVNIYANYLDIGTAYWQSNLGEIIPLENFGQIGSTNPKFAHSQIFSLSLNARDSGTLWIYIQSQKFTTPVDVKFYSKTEFYNTQFFVNSISSISFTVMITLALIALFIYFRSKYLVTLACAGYIGLQGIGWFVASGSLGHLFSVSTFNPVYVAILIFPFVIASASQFTKLLFNCQQAHIKLTKTFNLLSLITVILGIVMPFLPFTHSYLISHIIAIIWIPLCIGTGIFMLTKKDFKAKYYLMGNLLYGIALALYVLSHTYKFNWSISPELIVQMALTIDCICILLSLAEWLQIKQREFNRSYTISRIDPLTQVGNRFALNEKLSSLTGYYCLVFIDLDNFKGINDKLGHEAGDNFLIEFSGLMQQKIQDLGSIFRSGGDEFILVVSIKKSKSVDSLLIKLSELILKTEQKLQENGWQKTGLSFGIATSIEAVNQSDCLSLADKRMYIHKQNKKKLL